MSILLFAALLLAAGFAQSLSAADSTYGNLCTGNLGGFGAEWPAMTTELIAAAFALVTTAIALAYMYGKFREDPRAEVWAKDEAYNLMLSVLLFIGLLAFFVGSCELSVQINGSDPIHASVSYMDTLLNNNGIGILKGLTIGSINNQMSALKYLYTGIAPISGSGVATTAGYKALSAQKEVLIDIYTPILASLNAQRYILLAITWMQASVLLPFAFILRLVPPTREYGNMFIAMLFGIYVIVPAAYCICSSTFGSITSGNGMTGMMGTSSGYDFYDYSLDAQGQTGAGTVLYQIGSTIPQAVFIPNLILIITVTCTMAVWKAIKAVAA